MAPIQHIGTHASTFLTGDQKVTVVVPKTLVMSLLRLCDGHLNIGAVINALAKRWERRSLLAFLHELHHRGILTDVRSQSQSVWRFVKNPSVFNREVSTRKAIHLAISADRRQSKLDTDIKLDIAPLHLAALLQQRKSERSFAADGVAEDAVAALLWAGYGITGSTVMPNGRAISRKSVPSAGALYPLHLSLALFRSADSLQRGVYHVSFPEKGAVALKRVNGDATSVTRSFCDPLVYGAQGAIVVSAVFSITERKYANRSILYIPLEAGHVAQNIHLAATELGVATIEIGGFYEDYLRQAVQLPQNHVPLITVLFGLASSDAEPPPTDDDIETEWALPAAGQYRLPFAMAFGRIKGVREWSCGRAMDPKLAYAKARSEAEEWASGSRVNHRKLTRASIDELTGAVDPRLLTRYHSSQYQRATFPYQPWNPRRRYAWAEGEDIIAGKKVFILAECAYFPYPSHAKLYTHANSSGTAAFPTKQGALERATLELVERDAFMIAWLNGLSMPHVPLRSIPGELARRVRAVEQVGYRVAIVDLTLDLTPVILVFAQSQELTATTVAAASALDIIAALDHALKEVESSVYCRIANGAAKAVPPRLVRFTYHHGALYEHPRYYHQADFLAASRVKLSISAIGTGAPRTWDELLGRLSAMGTTLIAVDLPSRRPDDLHIVKCFIPGLIPMSFGYGEEPCGMQRLYVLPVERRLLAKSKSLEKLSKFPHPYA